MEWFNNMKIGKKLISAFITLAIISSVLIGTVALVNINSINSLSAKIYKEDLVPLEPIYKAEIDFLKMRLTIRDLALCKEVDRPGYSNTINELQKSLSTDLENYSKHIVSPEQEQNYKLIIDNIERYYVTRDKAINLITSNQFEDAMLVMNGEAASLATELDRYIGKAFEISIKQADSRNKSNTSTGNTAIILMIVIVLAAIAFSTIAGIFIARIISKPITKLTDAANKLSNGDLDINLKINTKDEVGSLANAFEKTILSINNLTIDANILAQAAVEGKLSTRVDALKHHGEYRKIVEGVNATLDAVIDPLNEAEQVMKSMSLNDFTVEIKGHYKGMLGEFSNAINDVRTRLLSVQDAVVRVSKGDTGRLEEFHKLGKRSQNDQLMPAVTAMMQTIRDLIQEAAKLATSAVDGDLSIRGNAGKFEGGYTEIIEGMNRTMDAVAQPLQEAAAVMQEMEKGNLTISMNGDYKGEYAKIKEALNTTIQTFNDVLNDIYTSAQQVASGASQVSDSAQALSQGSTEQASSVQELTASLEEISVQTKQNAVNADQANELSITAKENAAQGNEQMLGMLKAMEEINESSSNISKIIKVIDEIAFQTNILALNAAVEAARAGQHGKGFAVVAEEVRNLAARSANAAKETTSLIEGSIKKSEGGTKIANETALALNKIVDGVSKAASLVGGIALASNEQAAAIAQINQGIMQVSQVTQTNSATSEESAAASEELSSQAELLNEMVGKFNLRKGNSVKNLNDLSPELIRMLENMTEKKRSTDTFKHEKKGEAITSKMKIALSDSEFGKY
ncbi:MAG: HAMP domain-containing methyl-accepting chemotaxis protein [Ruminiclostridium sp.]